MWIFDLRATDHMTPHLQFFETYKTFEITKQIIIANGASVPISGKSSFLFNPWLPLNKVLHVPSLTRSLISIHKLTKDLNCFAIFSPHMCKFQAKDTERMIGVAKEHNGLYILEGKNNCSKRRQHRMAYSS